MANYWCKLNLDIMEADWFSNPNMLQLYIFFLLYSSRNRLNDKEVSFNISYKIIESYTGMERRAIRWYMERLREEGVIEICANCRDVTKHGTNHGTCYGTNNGTCYGTKSKWLKMRVILSATENKEQNEISKNESQRHILRQQQRQEERRDGRHDVRHLQDFYLFNNNIDNKDIKEGGIEIENFEQNFQTTTTLIDIGKEFLERIKAEWNSKTKDLKEIKPIIYWGQVRIQNLKALASHFGSLESLQKILFNCFDKIVNSEFLKGNNRLKWKCSIDWLISSPENIAKILEGKYSEAYTQYKQPNTIDNETKCRRIKTQNIGADSKAQSAEDFSETL